MNENEILAKVDRLIRLAGESDIELFRSDFTVDSDGFLTLDGMDAEQWVDAMTMR